MLCSAFDTKCEHKCYIRNIVMSFVAQGVNGCILKQSHNCELAGFQVHTDISKFIAMFPKYQWYFEANICFQCMFPS